MAASRFPGGSKYARVRRAFGGPQLVEPGATSPVTSFEGRTGAITLQASDLDGLIPHGFALSIIDLPDHDPADPLVRFLLTEDWEFLVGGEANSEFAATGNSVFNIKKDTVVVGTVTFAAASDTGVVAFTDSVFPDGSIFEVFAPSSADATLDRVSISIPLNIG